MLSEIIARKKVQLAESQQKVPLSDLARNRPEILPPKLSTALDRESINIIAEIKYRSPSRGPFPCKIAPRDLARIYIENGAAALSILTEEYFFDGQLEYLKLIRESEPATALLRKDFILDRYQLLEAQAYGASAALLIVACLKPKHLAGLISFAADSELEVLTEVHDPWELEAAIQAGARMIGVNNRNLKTFEVNLQTSFDLARELEGEEGFLLISESGLRERSQVLELRQAGFSGFLIGSALMEAQDPGATLQSFLAED